jgi:hypothetical protein
VHRRIFVYPSNPAKCRVVQYHDNASDVQSTDNNASIDTPSSFFFPHYIGYFQHFFSAIRAMETPCIGVWLMITPDGGRFPATTERAALLSPPGPLAVSLQINN